jgi:hypothetical protein
MGFLENYGYSYPLPVVQVRSSDSRKDKHDYKNPVHPLILMNRGLPLLSPLYLRATSEGHETCGRVQIKQISTEFKNLRNPFIP